MINYRNLEEYLVYKITNLESLISKTHISYGMAKGVETYRTIINGKKHEYRSNTPAGRALAIRYEELKRQKLIIQDLKNSLKLIREYKKSPAVIRNLNPGLTNCRRLFGEWEDIKIKENPYTNRTKHIHNGVDYDSKAEVSIAEVYEAMHIPFIHNGIIDLGDFCFAADFVPLIVETKDYFIHEHYGMEMKGRYLNTAVNKYSKLLENGLILGKDVLFTYENAQNFVDKNYIVNSITLVIRNIIGI